MKTRENAPHAMVTNSMGNKGVSLGTGASIPQILGTISGDMIAPKNKAISAQQPSKHGHTKKGIELALSFYLLGQ